MLFSSGKVPRQELADPIDRMLANTAEHFPQVRFGLDAVEHTSAYDGVKDRRTLAASIGPEEQPILPADSDAAQRILYALLEISNRSSSM